MSGFSPRNESYLGFNFFKIANHIVKLILLYPKGERMVETRYGNIGYRLDLSRENEPLINVVLYSNNDQDLTLIGQMTMSETEQLSSELFEAVNWYG